MRPAIWATLTVGVVLLGLVAVVALGGAEDDPAAGDRSRSTAGASTPGASDGSPGATDGTAGGTAPAPLPEDTPGATVETLLRAIADGDCAAAMAVVTDTFLDHNGECTAALPERFDWALGGETVDESTATAVVVCRMDGAEHREQYRFHLVAEDGTWKVDTIS